MRFRSSPRKNHNVILHIFHFPITRNGEINSFIFTFFKKIENKLLSAIFFRRHAYMMLEVFAEEGLIGKVQFVGNLLNA